MGIELTKALFARHAGGLTASELVVMGYMCVTALDQENAKGQPARMYFAGREPLALALGYLDATISDAAVTKVKRAIRGLRNKGLIEATVDHAQIGSRQCYRITFGMERGSDIDPRRGSDYDPQEGVIIEQKRGSDSDPPRTYLGRGQDSPQDTSTQSVTELQIARVRRELDRKKLGSGG